MRIFPYSDDESNFPAAKKENVEKNELVQSFMDKD